MNDLPIEVAIEIEPRCNFNCHFCFNRISFAGKEGEYRDKASRLSFEYLKKLLEKIRSIGIGIVRFTGGEPLLHPEVFKILEYAKGLGFREIRMNTNGSLITKKNAARIAECVDNFLIPIESANDETEDKITGFKNTLSKKIEIIGMLSEAGAKKIRIGTVVAKEAIDDLEKIESLVAALPIWSWELYRPISLKGAEVASADLNNFIFKLSKLKKQRPGNRYFIANAFPFCVNIDRSLVDSMSYGAIYDEGHSRFIVDPRGFAKAHYFISERLGDPMDPLACWNHPFLIKMRNLEFLPKQCAGCPFALKCRGGSRFAAKAVFGSWDAPDPLAPIANSH